MSSIITYDSNLGNGDGAFITPNNEIILTYGEHEGFAAKYCSGIDYFYSSLSDKNKNPYASSKLTKEQLELYKLWLEQNEFYRRKMRSDFMVFVLGFDKIETIMRRAITTTSRQPHIRFYNYYLMDWYIDKQTPMKYSEETGLFEYDEPKDWMIYYNEDRKVEDEINEIKAKVLRKDRHHFFK